MGRGASRSKSGGMMVMKDAERKILINRDNISFFEFLQEGCFEKDYMNYCSNRLNDYSCVHWLDPDSIEMDRKSLKVFENSTALCYHEQETPTQMLTRISIALQPPFIIFATISCLLSIPTLRRISRLHIPALYLLVLAIFDLMEILFRGGDNIIESFFNVRVVYGLQILSRSACQMLPFGFNLFKHFQGCLYAALAIDNWRFVDQPRQIYERYRPEWIRNVFIVIASVLVTLNSQFFWTFDVTENDNIPLHNRMVKSTFECSFSKTWPLQLGFIDYFWPISDHIAGEILPTLLTLVFSIRALIRNANQKLELNIEQVHQLRKYIIDLDLLLQMNRCISLICLMFGVFSIPRTLYFSSKYISYQFAYSEESPNFDISSQTPGTATAPKLSSEDIKAPLLYTTEEYSQILYKESLLENLEFATRYLLYLFLTLKFLLLLKHVCMARQVVLSLVHLHQRNTVSTVTIATQSSASSIVSPPKSSTRLSAPNNNSSPVNYSGGTHSNRVSNKEKRNVTDNSSTVMLTFKHRSASCNTSNQNQPNKIANESLLRCSYNM